MKSAKFPANRDAYAKLVGLLGDGLNPGPWAAKVTASFATDDGYAWNAVVYRDGAKVGEAQDQGFGGGATMRIDAAHAAALNEYAAAQTWNLSAGARRPHDAETFISTLAEIHMDMKGLKRQTARKTVFLEDGKTFTLNVLVEGDGPQHVRFISAHPHATILNAMLAGV